MTRARSALTSRGGGRRPVRTGSWYVLEEPARGYVERFG
jgi:hypothetical protein